MLPTNSVNVGHADGRIPRGRVKTEAIEKSCVNTAGRYLATRRSIYWASRAIERDETTEEEEDYYTPARGVRDSRPKIYQITYTSVGSKRFRTDVSSRSIVVCLSF